MNLKSLVGRLQIRVKTSLPGSAAHELLRAKPVGKILPVFNHKLPPKPGSVLILLYEENGTIKFPLIKRSTYTGAHSAQISLPGGKVESGEDSYQAAVREGEEEIGINKYDVQIIGKLSDFDVLPSNFLVTPVIGFMNYTPAFTPDPYEVEKVIHADLFELLKDDAVKEKEILAAGVYPMLAPHFLIEDEIVWGATGMILYEFVIVVRELLSQPE